MNAPEPNPYVGLRPFETADSPLFFGRTPQVTELLECLHRGRFLGVVGSSGCGKSSLIKAGLVPALHGGFLIEDRDDWEVAYLTPGDDPMGQLVKAVNRVYPDSVNREELGRVADRSVLELRDRILELVSDRSNLLLVVDQFEELFSFRRLGDAGPGSPEPEAPAGKRASQASSEDFVRLLLGLAGAGKQVYVVVTMRSDFLGDCDVFDGLPEAMNRGRYLVPRLTPGQLELAIRGPAKLYGVDVARALLDRLRNELGARFDRLPILQHALMRTWDERKGAPSLSVDHYEDAGTLESALQRHADELMCDAVGKPRGTKLTVADTADLGRVMKSLVDTDPSGRQTRRAVRRSKVVDESGLSLERVTALLAPFVTAGFVVADDATPDNPRYVLSHESLIRQWNELRRWAVEEHEARENFRELVARARALRTRGLLRGAELAFLHTWWHKRKPLAAWADRYAREKDDYTRALWFLRFSSLRRGVLRFVSVAVLGGVAYYGYTQFENERRRLQKEVDLLQKADSAEKRAAEAEKRQQDAEGRAKDADTKLKDADTKLKDADQKAADVIADAQAEARSLRADAKSALDRAAASAANERAATITSRLDASDAGNIYWDLGNGTDELRQLVVRRVLGSESESQRFMNEETRVMAALLGASPKQRSAAIGPVFAKDCINRLSGASYAYASDEVCRVLAYEFGNGPGAAAAPGLRTAVNDAVRNLIDSTRFDALSRAYRMFGELLDSAAIDESVTALATRNNNYEVQNAAGEFLRVAGARLTDSQIQRVARFLPDAVESIRIDSLNGLETVFGRLTPEQATDFQRTIRASGLLSPEERSVRLSLVARHLTPPEVSEVRDSLLAELTIQSSNQSWRDRQRFEGLTRIGNALSGSALSAHQERLLAWLDRQNALTTFDPAPVIEVLKPGRASLPAARVRALLPTLVTAPDRAIDGSQALPGLAVVSAAGAWDLLPETTITKLPEWLQRASLNSAFRFTPEFMTSLKEALLSLMTAQQGDTTVARAYSRLAEIVDDARWTEFVAAVPPTPAGFSSLAEMASNPEPLRARGALQKLSVELQGQSLSDDLLREIAHLAEMPNLSRRPLWDAITELVVRELEGPEVVAFAAAEAFVSLRSTASAGQVERAIRGLVRRLPSHGREVAQLGSDLTPSQGGLVVRSLMAAEPKDVWAIARLQRFLTPDQRRQIATLVLQYLAADGPSDASLDSYADTVPLLNDSQVQEATNLLMRPEGLGALPKGGWNRLLPALMARLPSGPRQSTVESLVKRIFVSGGRLDPNTLVPLLRAWPSLSTAERNSIVGPIAAAIEQGRLLGLEELAEFGGAVPALRDAARKQLFANLARHFGPRVNGLVAQYQQLDGVPQRAQALVDLITIPGVSPTNANALAVMLAQEAGQPAGRFLRDRRPGQRRRFDEVSWTSGLEVDLWQLTTWANSNGLTMRTIRHPAAGTSGR